MRFLRLNKRKEPTPSGSSCDPFRHIAHLAAQTQAYCDLGPLNEATIDRWPITEKSTVRNSPEWYQTGIPGDIRLSSSGTTGHPLPVYRSRDEFDENVAAVASRWNQLLVKNANDERPRFMSLLDHNRTAAGQLVEGIAKSNRWLFARSFPYTSGDSRFDQLAEDFIEFKPTVVLATPGELADLEEDWRRSGVFPQASRSVDAALLIGAPASGGMRRRLERTWQANVYIASFGSTELGTIATGCEAGKLHLLSGRHHLELRSGSAVTPLELGNCGELIVTPLRSQATVLVRYATGDKVSVVGCQCPSTHTAIVVHGREDDRVLLRDESIGPEEIEAAIFDEGNADDYMLEVDRQGQLLGVQALSFTDQEVDLGAITDALGVRARMVDSLSRLARAGGAVKSWRRTRTVVIYEPGAPN